MRHYSARFVPISTERYGLFVNVPKKPAIQVDYAPASKVGKASLSPNISFMAF